MVQGLSLRTSSLSTAMGLYRAPSNASNTSENDRSEELQLDLELESFDDFLASRDLSGSGRLGASGQSPKRQAGRLAFPCPLISAVCFSGVWAWV